MKAFIEKLSKRIPVPPLLIISFLIILSVWLFYTPPGLLGKMDAIGYAVCHRIIARSYLIGDRALPLCARCTGMHLGCFFGLLVLMRRGKRGGLPIRKFLFIFALFLMAFGLDGVNSYLNLINRFPYLYTTQNWMRLVSGAFVGIGISAVIYPIFNQSMWRDWIEEPVLKTWKQMGAMILVAILVFLAILSENPILLYPLAILSALNVLLVLSMIYTIIWVMLTRHDNQFNRILELRWYLLAGLTTAILQIAVMDYGRFLLTGTWNGFFS
jgi:uncharacterized membrane protein